MSDAATQAREDFFAEIAETIREGAAEHGLDLATAFDMALDEIERGVAAALGIELCDCDDHTQH